MKIAVVTGASSGIGREICFALQDRIPAVEEFWLFSRSKEGLEKTASQLFKKTRIFPVDLKEKEGLERYRSALAKEKPQILFLVNAAGFGKLGEANQLLEADQLDMIDVNCKALTAFTLHSIPFMRRNSRIIQMASAAAFLPQREFSVYAATKSYVYSFSISLREELRERGIGVTAVCPGPVATEFFKVAGNEGKLHAVKSLFMAKPKKVALKALMDSVLNRPLSIYGFPMKGFYCFSQILPDTLLMCILRGFYK